MDAFLVITGVILLAIIIAVVIMYKKGINFKFWNVQVKHWLIVVGIVVAIIAVIVFRVVLGKNSRLVGELLSKLRKSRADSDLKVIDEKLLNNKQKSGAMDIELEELEKDVGANKVKIDNLKKKKESIDTQIDVLDTQYSNKKKETESLEDKVKKMKERLNRG